MERRLYCLPIVESHLDPDPMTTIDSPRERPRVAIIYHFFAHYRAAVVEELARSEAADYDFFADTCDYEGSIKTAEFSPAVRFHRCRVRQLRGPIMWQRGLIGLALSRRFDTMIFLAGPYWPATWLSAMLARLAGKRVFFWGHGWNSPPRGFTGVVRNAFYRLAHQLLLYGHDGKQLGLAQGWRPNRLHVIFNSLDVKAQNAALAALPSDSVDATRRRLFGSSDRPVVICTTRLVPHRRLDLLIEALKLLADQGVHANLLIVGDGPERHALERQAKALGVSAVFTGAVYAERDLAPLITCANVMAAPGKIGLAAMHALAYGVPIVTHDDPDDQMPEYEAAIPGLTGGSFRRGDAKDLARALRPWLAQARPPQAVQQACRQVIDRFYNPWFQRAAIDRAVLGREADDIFWLREGVPRPAEADGESQRTAPFGAVASRAGGDRP